MSIEHLPKTEIISGGKTSDETSVRHLNKDGIDRLLQERMTQLAELSPAISRKLLFALEEKLQNEKLELESLGGLEEARLAHNARYSLILDPAYFEQELLT